MRPLSGLPFHESGIDSSAPVLPPERMEPARSLFLSLAETAADHVRVHGQHHNPYCQLCVQRKRDLVVSAAAAMRTAHMATGSSTVCPEVMFEEMLAEVAYCDLVDLHAQMQPGSKRGR